jgi:hypothetical protein
VALGSGRPEGGGGGACAARDLHSAKAVAVKALRPEFTQRPGDVQRFFCAAETVLPLRHLHLLPLREVGQDGPYCWLAMDWI